MCGSHSKGLGKSGEEFAGGKGLAEAKPRLRAQSSPMSRRRAIAVAINAPRARRR